MGDRANRGRRGRLEDAGIVAAIVFGLIGALTGTASLVATYKIQARQEALAAQDSAEQLLDRASGMVVFQRDGYVSVANYTAYPVSDVTIEAFERTEGAAALPRVGLGDLPPCHEFQVPPAVEQEVIGGDKGPLPTIRFIDSYGQGWMRAYFERDDGSGLSNGGPQMTDQTRGSLSLGPDVSYDLPPRPIEGCDI